LATRSQTIWAPIADKTTENMTKKFPLSEKDIENIGFEDILHYTSDFILLCNSDFDIVKSNHAADIILGQGKSIASQKCYKVLRGSDLPCADCPLKETFRNGVIIPVSYYDERLDEYFEERTHPIASKTNSIKGFVIQGKNASKLREIEQKNAQDKKLSALGRISSGVAHDFNNVLTGVLGRIQLLRNQTDDAYVLEGLEKIEKAATDGAAKVKKIQDFSRANASDVAEIINVAETINDVVDMTRSKWKDGPILQGIIVDTKTDLDENLYIEGNISDIRNLITNLIFNAVDAMPDGGLITITAEEHNQQAFIRISDTGTGMTEETIEKIFDPFFTTKGLRGTGLGLSEVFGAIKRHKGNIKVESKVGRGSIFTITLPLSRIQKAGEETKRSCVTECARIMIIDDENYILEILSEMLVSLGHKVTSYESGRLALSEFSKDKFDIIITDMGMPDITGEEIVIRVREIDPTIQIVLMSGWNINLEEKNLHKIVNFTFGKPFVMGEIKDVVQNALTALNNYRK